MVINHLISGMILQVTPPSRSTETSRMTLHVYSHKFGTKPTHLPPLHSKGAVDPAYINIYSSKFHGVIEISFQLRKYHLSHHFIPFFSGVFPLKTSGPKQGSLVITYFEGDQS